MKKNTILIFSQFWIILVINLFLIFISIFFYKFEEENNVKKISYYLTKGKIGYWKEIFCHHDEYNDEYLYFNKDTSINFKKINSNKNLIFSTTHEHELKSIKKINKIYFSNNYFLKIGGFNRFLFQIQDDNKFRIVMRRDDSLTLHVFERVKEMPRIDTIASKKLKATYLEENKQMSPLCKLILRDEFSQKEEFLKHFFIMLVIVLFLIISVNLNKFIFKK